jgi:hypothetical protein
VATRVLPGERFAEGALGVCNFPCAAVVAVADREPKGRLTASLMIVPTSFL